jgi:hypothetical protein
MSSLFALDGARFSSSHQHGQVGSLNDGQIVLTKTKAGWTIVHLHAFRDIQTSAQRYAK